MLSQVERNTLFLGVSLFPKGIAKWIQAFNLFSGKEETETTKKQTFRLGALRNRKFFEKSMTRSVFGSLHFKA